MKHKSFCYYNNLVTKHYPYPVPKGIVDPVINRLSLLAYHAKATDSFVISLCDALTNQYNNTFQSGLIHANTLPI